MQLSLEKERMECLVSSFFSVLEVMPRRFFFHKNVGYYNFPLLPLLPCAIATVAMSTLSELSEQNRIKWTPTIFYLIGPFISV